MTPQPLRALSRHLLAAGLLGAALLASVPVQAQIASATVRGSISAAGAKAPAGTDVVAVNKANGNTHRTKTQADGSYVLLGLSPGVYEIRVGGAGSGQTVELAVGENATIDLSSGSNQLQTVVISGSALRQNARDTQVSTVVSNKMIEALPQFTRNFLSAVDLAPGARFDTDASGNTRIRGGAQNEDAVNVFIDGVGRKNNILRGGVAGQDTSQGNPFPQGAISQYRILTQNYKAEFDQLSSVAVSAVTKSGTNEFHGDVYVNRTGDSYRQKSPVEKEREAAGVPRPPFTQMESGFSLGGPIQKDALHFFVAYDGKSIERPAQIFARNIDKYPTKPGIIAQLEGLAGPFTKKFTEHLLFGKLSAQLGEEQKIDLAFSLRDEDSLNLESETASASTAINNKNTEKRLDLSHEWARDVWLNEFKAGVNHSRWNPRSDANTPLIRYKYSPTNLRNNIQDIIWDGGSPNAQDRGQRETYFKNDLSYTGINGHVIKGGAKLSMMKYELSGTASRVDQVDAVVSTITGQPFYANGLCTGTGVINGGLESDQCRIVRAIPPVEVNFSNKQYGLFLQDDWSVTRQLDLSLGLRWDYESNMLNNSYVTPADRVAALKAADGRTIGGITAPAGQTYAQSLAKGGINIDDFISTGNSRKPYKKALAPRLGFSFDTTGNRSTVIYGGWGRAYDRKMANNALDELQKNAQAGGEIWLVKNDYKMPYADQISIGVRQALGDWNLDVSLSDQHAKNQFIWYGGNRDPNGGWGTQSSIDPLWGGPNGFGTLVLGDTVGENRSKSVFVKLEKPYTAASGWSVSAAFTHTDAKTTNKEWTTDIFDWTYGRNAVRGWNPAQTAEKDRIVLAGFTDKLPWGMGVSGKWTWGTGQPRRVTDCSRGFSDCRYVEFGSDNFSQLDMGVYKEMKFSFGAIRLRADVLNVLNRANWGYYNDWGGGPSTPPQNAVGGDNPDLGKRTGLRGDMRTFKITASYAF